MVAGDKSPTVLTLSFLLKGHSRGSDEVLMSCSRHCGEAALDQVSTLEERSLLSFQRPVPVVLTA
jgi:hypothetical protein